MPTLVSNAHIGTHCTPHEKNSIVKNYSETPLPALIKEVHTSHYIKYIMYIVIYKNEYPCMCVTKQWIPLHVCIAKMNIIHVCNTTTNTIHACFTTANAICVGLARTVHVRIYTPYVWWFPSQKYRMYTVYIWFWPTLHMCICVSQQRIQILLLCFTSHTLLPARTHRPPPPLVGSIDWLIHTL